MTKSSEPPVESLCATCSVRSGWRSLTGWTRILVPILIGIICSLVGMVVAQAVRAATSDEAISALQDRRHEDREEVRQTRGDLVRLERDNAVAHTEILRGITRLETLIKTREDQ